MNYRNQKGFTLIEVMVVAGIIAILAGVLVPMIFNQIDQSRIARAQGDVKSIAASIQAFRKDTSKWPNFSGGTYPCAASPDGDGTTITVLATTLTYPQVSSGLPGNNEWNMTSPTQISALLKDIPAKATPANSCYPEPTAATMTGWRGPYMTDTPADPWGNAYVVNAIDFETSTVAKPTDSVWVLSAGPNGMIETGSASANLGGDDVGVKIK
jgi:general secretion pathway protein G